MYESPIKIIESAMDSISKSLIKEKEDAIILEVKRSLGVDIDRSELLEALQYDRFQYDKGYEDGRSDAEAALVRCKDCKYWNEKEEVLGQCRCINWKGIWDYTKAYDFCSYGERREGE